MPSAVFRRRVFGLVSVLCAIGSRSLALGALLLLVASQLSRAASLEAAPGATLEVRWVLPALDASAVGDSSATQLSALESSLDDVESADAPSRCASLEHSAPRAARHAACAGLSRGRQPCAALFEPPRA
jgi:hypothetical protein